MILLSKTTKVITFEYIVYYTFCKYQK